MIERRIRLVFEAMAQANVMCLLMGGQACVLYGAAEFSKDVDFVVLSDAENISRIIAAMDILNAAVIAVPDFSAEHLNEGLAVHFRCQAPGVEGLRVDVMTKLRGLEDFKTLWERRTIVEDGDGGCVSLLHIRDLVSAKKTQRDKDWPMIQRLMEVRYLSSVDEPNAEEIQFWLSELRTPELLVDASSRFPDQAHQLSKHRPLLIAALANNLEDLIRQLNEEMMIEKEQDRLHWQPLRTRLATLRRAKLDDRNL